MYVQHCQRKLFPLYSCSATIGGTGLLFPIADTRIQLGYLAISFHSVFSLPLNHFSHPKTCSVNQLLSRKPEKAIEIPLLACLSYGKRKHTLYIVDRQIYLEVGRTHHCAKLSNSSFIVPPKSKTLCSSPWHHHRFVCLLLPGAQMRFPTGCLPRCRERWQTKRTDKYSRD